MNIPYIPEQLLEINEDINPVFLDRGIIIVDNWYKHFDLFQQVVKTLPAARWKWSDQGRNFKDYYDCRSKLSCNFLNVDNIKSFETIKNLIKYYFRIDEQLVLKNNPFDFNIYKNIKKDIPNKLQHHPHIDHYFNCIVYFDDVSSGGTAIYKDIDKLENNEHINLLYDVSKLNYKLIKAVPNRLAIFPGTVYHGGYIDDHNQYVDNWRINQVLFFIPK